MAKLKKIRRGRTSKMHLKQSKEIDIVWVQRTSKALQKCI